MEMDKVADTKSSRPEGLPARSRGPQDLYNLYMKEMFFFFILSKIVFSRRVSDSALIFHQIPLFLLNFRHPSQ